MNLQKKIQQAENLTAVHLGVAIDALRGDGRPAISHVRYMTSDELVHKLFKLWGQRRELRERGLTDIKVEADIWNIEYWILSEASA